jgi:hypothetical protein
MEAMSFAHGSVLNLAAVSRDCQVNDDATQQWARTSNYPAAAPVCMYGSAHKAIIGEESSIDGSNAVCSVPN